MTDARAPMMLLDGDRGDLDVHDLYAKTVTMATARPPTRTGSDRPRQVR